jgi:Rrf2 family protein
LRGKSGAAEPCPEIAAAYSVSELFLFKILQPLVENGMIETVRGRNGGIRLGRPASEITLFEVVRATEDNFAMAECFENEATDCPLVDSCKLNEALRKALGAFFEVLEATRSRIWREQAQSAPSAQHRGRRRSDPRHTDRPRFARRPDYEDR